MSALSDIVAKFRKASPNIAAAFDEVERRLVALEKPTTPPPPPPPVGPWGGWLYEVSLAQVGLPNRHIAHTDRGVTLTAYPDTPKLGTDRQLVSAYLGGGAAQAAEGREVTYETTVTFEPGFQWTTGELNWLIEWHTMTGNGAGKLSNAIGVTTDYPVAMGKPGTNPRWHFRPHGPSGGRDVFGPAVTAGRTYRVKVAILWSIGTAGRFRVWLDDAPVCDERMPTLWAGDDPAFGFYNYRLAAPWTSAVTFSKPTIGV